LRNIQISDLGVPSRLCVLQSQEPCYGALADAVLLRHDADDYRHGRIQARIEDFGKGLFRYFVNGYRQDPHSQFQQAPRFDTNSLTTPRTVRRCMATYRPHPAQICVSSSLQLQRANGREGRRCRLKSGSWRIRAVSDAFGGGSSTWHLALKLLERPPETLTALVVGLVAGRALAEARRKAALAAFNRIHSAAADNGKRDRALPGAIAEAPAGHFKS
jgi:hypothetical protein